MMVPTSIHDDERAAAKMLWELKAIATKEMENIPFDSFFVDNMEESSSKHRGRTISVESADIVSYTAKLAFPFITKAFVEQNPLLLDNARENSVDHLNHHNWGTPAKKLTFRPSVKSTGEEGKQSKSKRKRESYVGLTTKSGIIRSTLRKKFSWKQYPKLEDYLLKNQEEYFKYSSRNYSAEQRNYNNGLTRGLLELASSEGYIFEHFIFSMVRDRIRCYYKSHSQSAKKRKR